MTNYPRYILHNNLVVQKDNALQNTKHFIIKNNFEKLVVQISFKSLNFNTKKTFFIVKTFLEFIAGQKPKVCFSKKDSSMLKLRKNDIVALSVTLRKRKLFFFVENFVNYICPKTKPFIFLSNNIRNIDGNESFTLKNVLLLPELEKEFNLFIKNLGAHNTQVSFSYKKMHINMKKTQLVSYQFPLKEV